MPKKRFKSIKIDEKGYDYLSFIADRLNQKKSVFLRRLLDEVFEIMSTYRKGSAVLFYDGTGNQLILTSSGDSVLEFGIRPVEDPEIAKKEASTPPIVKLISEKPLITKFPCKVEKKDE